MAGPERSLRDLIEETSVLSPVERGEDKALGLIARGLASALEPSETLLAYADRGLDHLSLRREIDGLSFDQPSATDESDALVYESEGRGAETDAMAYDVDEEGAQQDVMRYRAGGRREDVDALAYDGAVQGPETDVFVSDASGERPADVDLLVLTDRRLLRGSLRHAKLTWREARQLPGELVLAAARTGIQGEGGAAIEAVWLDISLPVALCEADENGMWCWLLPEGLDAGEAASRWRPAR
jgi:hypothetical protein